MVRGRHSSLWPEDTTFWKIQRGYLHTTYATFSCVQWSRHLNNQCTRRIWSHKHYPITIAFHTYRNTPYLLLAGANENERMP